MNRIKLLTFTIFISINLFGQDSSWVKKSFNDILSLSVPVNAKYSNNSHAKTYRGSVHGNYYTFQYFDTTMNVENERQFQISLTGYVNSLLADPSVKKYQTAIRDTSIGGTKGILIELTSSDSSDSLKELECYVTLANRHFYVFQSAFTTSKNSKYFESIVFDPKKVAENSYVVSSIYLK